MKLPENLEVEKKLLSALMLGHEDSAEVIAHVSEQLSAEEFYREEHRCIYRAILAAAKSGEPVDITLIEDELKRSGELKKVRREYLFALLDYEFTTARVDKYIPLIKETAQRRQLINIGEELIDEAGDETKDVSEVRSTLESKLLKATANETPPSTNLNALLETTWREAQNRWKTGGELLGASTGMLMLDRLTCGLKKTDLLILAARPSMGKTALALNIALNAAREVPVAIFSMEMSASQLGQRILSMTSGVQLSEIATGQFDDQDAESMMMSMTEIYDARKHVEIDDSTLTMAELRMRARRLKRKYNVGLIVIDYIQLIIGDKAFKGNRVQEVSDISRQLKALAKELNVPVLALSQLNRGAEIRADKRPLLSDLRESGSIEQDADIVMFIYRDDYYNENSERKNVAEIHVAKNRNGATGRCNLFFDGSKCRFRDLVRSA